MSPTEPNHQIEPSYAIAPDQAAPYHEERFDERPAVALEAEDREDSPSFVLGYN